MFLALLVATVATARLAVAGNVETTVDNDTDLFVPGAATTDRNYTQGARIVWHSEPGEGPMWLDHIASRLGVEGEAATRRYGFGIGQEIHTPDAISRPVPDSRDRPYAGWLYATAYVAAAAARRERTFEVRAGMVGPSAFAAQTQGWWHRELGIRAPRGWSHQLRDEPGLQVSLSERRRLELPTSQAAIIPHARLALGNVHTHAALGVTAQVGSHAGRDFGPAPTAAAALPRPRGRSPVQLMAFAQAEGRAVLRDITLDGNTFGDGPSVSRHPWVGEARLGVGARLAGVTLRYAFSYTTHQFRERSDAHRYGSLTIAVL